MSGVEHKWWCRWWCCEAPGYHSANRSAHNRGEKIVNDAPLFLNRSTISTILKNKIMERVKSSVPMQCMIISKRRHSDAGRSVTVSGVAEPNAGTRGADQWRLYGTGNPEKGGRRGSTEVFRQSWWQMDLICLKNLSLFELQDPNVWWYTKVSATVLDAVHCYCLICEVTTQTSGTVLDAVHSSVKQRRSLPKHP